MAKSDEESSRERETGETIKVEGQQGKGQKTRQLNSEPRLVVVGVRLRGRRSVR